MDLEQTPGFSLARPLRVLGGLVLHIAGAVLAVQSLRQAWGAPGEAVLPALAGGGAAVLALLSWPRPEEQRNRRRWGGLAFGLTTATLLVTAATVAMHYVTAAAGDLQWLPGERIWAVRWASLLPAAWLVVPAAMFWQQIGLAWVHKGRPTVASGGGSQPTGDVVMAYEEDDRTPILLRRDDRYMHTMVCGPTGSGKTTTGLSPVLVQDIANPGVGLTILEPKGDWICGDGGRPGVVQWAQHYSRTLFKIDPADPHSDCFNPLHGDRHMVAEVNVVALKAIFGTNEPFFAASQEMLLKKALYLLKWVRGDYLTYWDLLEAISNSETAQTLGRTLSARLSYWRQHGIPKHLSEDDLQEAESLVQWARNNLYGEVGQKLYQVTLGLRVQVENLMNNQYFRRCVVPPKAPHRNERGEIIGGRTVDMDRHLAAGSILAVSTNDGLLADYSKVLGRMITTATQYAASRRFLRPPEERGLHVIWIDEAPTYLYPQWAEFQAKARGFNVAIVLALQDLSQLERIEKGFRNTIVNNSRTRVLYGGLQPDDVKFWMQAFGTKVSEQFTYSQNERVQPIHGYGEDPFSMLFPSSYRERTTGVSRRVDTVERISFNDLWELPRGKVLLQQVERGSIRPPKFATVRVLTPETMPPQLAVQPVDPSMGLAIPQGPLLEEVKGVVDPEAVKVKEAMQERPGHYTARDARRDAERERQKQGGSLLSRLGMERVKPPATADVKIESAVTVPGLPGGEGPKSRNPLDGDFVDLMRRFNRHADALEAPAEPGSPGTGGQEAGAPAVEEVNKLSRQQEEAPGADGVDGSTSDSITAEDRHGTPGKAVQQTFDVAENGAAYIRPMRKDEVPPVRKKQDLAD